MVRLPFQILDLLLHFLLILSHTSLYPIELFPLFLNLLVKQRRSHVFLIRQRLNGRGRAFQPLLYRFVGHGLVHVVLVAVFD
jgi:hypothetical protein